MARAASSTPTSLVASDNERAIDDCVERYGGIDILFCNAGVTLPKLLHESSDAEIDRLLGVNLLAVMYAARYAIPRMLSQPSGGTMLFTASKTGLVAQTDSPVYCASKGAVVMLAKALALDYATRGIRVNALCPGIIDTPMLQRVRRVAPGSRSGVEVVLRSTADGPARHRGRVR